MAAPTLLLRNPPVVAPRSPACPGSLAEGAAPFSINSDARRWFALAIGSLVVAGLLSLSVVIGRLPVIAAFVGDPLFFKRCLVVHVDLALVVWFYAFLAGLATLRAGGAASLLGRLGFAAAVTGVVAMLAGALMRGAQPVLANYVPVIDHPLFLGGLAAFFLGTLFALLETLATSARPAVGGPPEDAAAGIHAAIIAFVLAAATWLATRSALPGGLDPWTRYEFSAWGAGHVLQVANVAAMLAVWLWLLARATGRPVLSARGGRILFTLLLAPHFAMPLLTARGALDPLYHSGATQLMRWGIFPVVLAVLALSLRHLWRHAPGSARVPPASASGPEARAQRRLDPTIADPLARVARVGFYASASLTGLGFVLGACIRSSTTLVPAHYHASLGGITVAFMTAAYLVCAAARVAQVYPPAPKWPWLPAGDSAAGNPSHPLATIAPNPFRAAARQLTLFGTGQAVFALGFGIGGLYGLGRKAYASEQHVRSVGELVGLGVMGLGGLAATVAGVWFLVLVVREIRHWWTPRSSAAPAPASGAALPLSSSTP